MVTGKKSFDLKKKKKKVEVDHRGQKLKIAKSTSRVLAVCHT